MVYRNSDNTQMKKNAHITIMGVRKYCAPKSGPGRGVAEEVCEHGKIKSNRDCSLLSSPFSKGMNPTLTCLLFVVKYPVKITATELWTTDRSDKLFFRGYLTSIDTR